MNVAVLPERLKRLSRANTRMPSLASLAISRFLPAARFEIAVLQFAQRVRAQRHHNLKLAERLPTRNRVPIAAIRQFRPRVFCVWFDPHRHSNSTFVYRWRLSPRPRYPGNLGNPHAYSCSQRNRIPRTACFLDVIFRGPAECPHGLIAFSRVKSERPPDFVTRQPPVVDHVKDCADGHLVASRHVLHGLPALITCGIYLARIANFFRCRPTISHGALKLSGSAS